MKSWIKSTLQIFTAIAVLTCAPATTAQVTQDVGVEWTANTEPDLGGYQIYWSKTNHLWTHTMAVPKMARPNVTIRLLDEGKWWFMVVATNLAGKVSNASNSASNDDVDGEQARTFPAAPTLSVIARTVTQTSTITTVSNIIVVPYRP